jgi:AraC-like DNA-binding protein
MISIKASSIDRATRLRGAAQSAWHLAMVQRGGYVVTLSSGYHEVSPGTARISPPGAAPWVQIDRSGASCVIVDAGGPFWTRVFARASREPWRETALSHRRVDIAREVGACSFDLASIGRSLTMFWPEEHHAGIAREASQQIDAGFRTISLTQLASDFAIPRGRFAALFLSATGFRPAEYRTLRRIEAAREHLANTGLALAEISDLAGFADQSHMTASLRAVLGLSPLQVRTAAAQLADSISKDRAGEVT